MKIFSDRIILRQPDDWHLHLRDGDLLNLTVAHTSRVFRRAIIMPNLIPPVDNIELAKSYRKRILDATPENLSFVPLMTAYLKNNLRPEVLAKGFHDGVFHAAKLYPANVTTNSSEGISDLTSIGAIFEVMEEIGMPLLIHGEVNDDAVDIFDREAVFIERHLEPLLKSYPHLRVVLEHITTNHAVQFVEANALNLAATITPHHLHINRNAMFYRGFRSDFYCLPIAKKERHRLALRRAATSGKPCFFLGTDSAPHLRPSKESSCACAGIFNAPCAIESYTEVFDEEGALDKLEAFASENGPKFYKLPLNTTEITLLKRPNLIPERLDVDLSGNKTSEAVVPFHAGETLNWSFILKSNSECL